MSDLVRLRGEKKRTMYTLCSGINSHEEEARFGLHKTRMHDWVWASRRPSRAGWIKTKAVSFLKTPKNLWESMLKLLVQILKLAGEDWDHQECKNQW